MITFKLCCKIFKHIQNKVLVSIRNLRSKAKIKEILKKANFYGKFFYLKAVLK